MAVPNQWTFAFVGGRFDGYRHVADPQQVNRFQSPPDELHLWEAEAVICVRGKDEPDIDAGAERYCLRSVWRSKLEARYEHEKVYTGSFDNAADALSVARERQREPEPVAA